MIKDVPDVVNDRLEADPAKAMVCCRSSDWDGLPGPSGRRTSRTRSGMSLRLLNSAAALGVVGPRYGLHVAIFGGSPIVDAGGWLTRQDNPQFDGAAPVTLRAEKRERNVSPG